MQSDRDEAEASDDDIFNPDDEELLSLPYNASGSNSSKDNDCTKSTSNSKNSSTAGSPKSALLEVDASSKLDDEKSNDCESEASSKIKEMIKDMDGSEASKKLEEAAGNTKMFKASEQPLEQKAVIITNASITEDKTRMSTRIQQ